MTTMTRQYGELYEATRDMTNKEIAAHVRRAVKDAAKAGRIPAGWQYSVRYERGTAITVTVIASDEVVALRNAFEQERGRRYTANLDDAPETLRVLAAVEQELRALLGRYNYDGSDIMTDYFDVRFYGFVNVTSATDWARFKC
jgi:hypothetical protein